MAHPLRIYHPFQLVSDEELLLEGEEFHYLSHVRRAREGDPVMLFGNPVGAWRATITRIEKKSACLRIGEPVSCPRERASRLLLGISVGKGRKLEEVVEQTTPFGVDVILPFYSEHTVAYRENPNLAQRLARIAIEASRQCGRNQVPIIHGIQDGLKALLTGLDPRPAILFADEQGGEPVSTRLGRECLPESILLLVGPEGGWSIHERALALDMGGAAITLGPRILRTELAAVAAVCLADCFLREAAQSGQLP